MLKHISRCLPEAAGNISPSLVCSRGHSPAIDNRGYHVSWQERVQGTPSSATHLPHLCQEQVFCLAPAAPSPLQLCCSGSRAQQGPGVPRGCAERPATPLTSCCSRPSGLSAAQNNRARLAVCCHCCLRTLDSDETPLPALDARPAPPHHPARSPLWQALPVPTPEGQSHHCSLLVGMNKQPNDYPLPIPLPLAQTPLPSPPKDHNNCEQVPTLLPRVPETDAGKQTTG